MNPPFLRRGLGCAVLLLSGCTTARLAIPDDLGSRADVYPCVGRDGFSFAEKISFGPYEVFDIHCGWTRRVA